MILLRSARQASENDERAKMLYLFDDGPVLYLPLALFEDQVPLESFVRRPDLRFQELADPEDEDEASLKPHVPRRDASTRRVSSKHLPIKFGQRDSSTRRAPKQASPHQVWQARRVDAARS